MLSLLRPLDLSFRAFTLTGFLLGFTGIVHADIRFEEVSRTAGIVNTGPSAGVAWGDLDGDGWPDLWVTGHHGHAPIVYLNLRNGSFSDVTSRVLPSWSPADLHGAAWADFDNDGDQDLVALSGGGAGKGHSPNQLFVNDGGVLREDAEARGVAYAFGRGRTPLWLDADGDGQLDLVVSNYRRPGGQAPTALFRQQDGRFVASSEAFAFVGGNKSRFDQWYDLARNVANGRYEWPGRISAGDFAQLADLSGDGKLELVTYSNWNRVFDVSSAPFEEITADFAWPSIGTVRDIAIEDFDGDDRLDFYLVRGRPTSAQVVLNGDAELVGLLVKGPAAAPPRAVQFVTDGDVGFELHPPWKDPSDSRPDPVVFVGSKRRTDRVLQFEVSATDAELMSSEVLPDIETQPGLAIAHDPSSGTWSLRSTLPRLTFVIRSTQPVHDVETLGFESSGGAEPDALLLRRGAGFVADSRGRSGATPESCHSAVAGDFDNDMDVDLYLVCSGPLQNRPNRLFENDGRGRLRLLPDAGGAAGSTVGRGDLVVSADYDRDGFLDLFVVNGQGPPPFADGPHQLFRNVGNDNHWIEIELVGTRSNRDAIGATVVVETAGTRQRRGQGGGMHSFAQNHVRLHFGLGPYPQVDRLTVHWPGGSMQTLEDVAADQILRLEEPRAGSGS